MTKNTRFVFSARATASGLSALLLVLSGSVHALPFTQDVFCDKEKCGTMEISKYEEFTANSTSASDKWLGGVEIKGEFKNIVKKRDYRYLQSIKTESDTFRWIKDASVKYPQPFLDVPPGGHKVRDAAGSATFTDQVFDFRPWYDGSTPPPFFDRPGDWMFPAKADADKKIEWAFETWLVCVIEAKDNGNMVAKDDSYKVATLLGWKWGYDVLYKDVGTIGTDEFADFTVTERAFQFVTTPSADWNAALGAKYGDPAKPADQDFWNITLDDCKKCRKVTEPSTLALLIWPALIVLLRLRRSNT